MPIINADESFLALSSDTLTSLCSSTREEIRECLENALSGQVTEQKLRRLLPSWHYGWLKRGDDKLNNFDVAKLVQHPTDATLVKPLNRTDIRLGIEGSSMLLSPAVDELLRLYSDRQNLFLILLEYGSEDSLVTVSNNNICKSNFETGDNDLDTAKNELVNSSILALKTPDRRALPLLSQLKIKRITGSDPCQFQASNWSLYYTKLYRTVA